MALVASACHGCKKHPALRLTYRVDVARAYDGPTDEATVMTATRDVIAHRLDDESTLPPDEGLALYQEMAPDGLDASGGRRRVKGSYARMACRPPKYASETVGACLTRLRAWTSTLAVPSDREVGVEAITEPIAGTDPPQFEQVAWRTLYLDAHAELTGASITNASVGQDQAAGGQYYVAITFSPEGARLFEDLTGANVNRRFAIVLDGIVDSAPVIRSKIGGGRAQITMGAGDPERQLRDASQLDLVLRSGALPAPMSLVSEVALGKGR